MGGSGMGSFGWGAASSVISGTSEGPGNNLIKHFIHIPSGQGPENYAGG